VHHLELALQLKTEMTPMYVIPDYGLPPDVTRQGYEISVRDQKRLVDLTVIRVRAPSEHAACEAVIALFRFDPQWFVEGGSHTIVARKTDGWTCD
jgi:hypothetical protein